MKPTMLGIIDATSYFESLEDLLVHRSLAAVPIGGRYRLIDFVLSSMVNSGIHSVAIFPKYQYRSLMDHLGSGKNWDLNRKRDGLFFFPAPALEAAQDEVGSFNHFAHHIDYFYRSNQEYAVLATCNTISNINFKPILERHIKIGSDITEVRHQGKALEMYLLKTDLLIDFITNRFETGYTCMRDVVEDLHHSHKVCGYELEGYVSSIECIQGYYETSMEMLTSQCWNSLFLKNAPIYTKVKDEPPTKYTSDSNVTNSMIANGCCVEGTVHRSILSRAVKVGKNSKIENSIIMQKSQIGQNCILEHVILDKDVKIEDNVRLIGDAKKPIVIRKGMIQGALMNS